MCDSEENYQDILQKNFYLFSRYIVAEDFLEQLISEDVLTVDDKEVITNKCIHHNRRERASKSLFSINILAHKKQGQETLNSFSIAF
jgi:hypothetical protein